MFESIINFFKKIGKQDKEQVKSKDAAKERLHLVLMQDRANVSADFLDLMKQEIIEVIKKYIDVDENAIDVRLTNKANGDGTTGAPALYANIPIVSIKEEVKTGMARQKHSSEEKKEENKEESKKENSEEQENKEIKNEPKKTPKTENKKKENIEAAPVSVPTEVKQENKETKTNQKKEMKSEEKTKEKEETKQEPKKEETAKK
ncbi:MAG: cell division topological specificity factor MinE [Clostridia bacterium]|nr:cell division topological specificity factor MinE [Clostridia bacterium]